MIAALTAAPGEALRCSTEVFDMDGRQIIQDEDQLGIANGKLTVGISYRDVTGVSGLWAPPFVSSNFMLDGRVCGERVLTTKWVWRPFQVEREGLVGDVAVSTTTTLIYGHRAAVVSFTFKNAAQTPAPLDLFTLGWLDSVQDWSFPRVGSGSQTSLAADGQRLTMQQGSLAVMVAIDSNDWKWEASGNLGHATALLPAGETRTVNVVIAIGPGDEAEAAVRSILGDPAGAVTTAKGKYARRVAEVFEKVPTLESNNADLVRWYNRSLVPFLLNRWDVPEFVLNPYYSTGGIKGGCVCNYLWDFGEVWEILPLYDAPAARTHITQFLKTDLLKHFCFLPVNGAAEGPWYMVNQEKIIGLTYYYVLLTGDVKFLSDTVDGKTILDHMVIHAMFGDDAGKPPVLIDYGSSNSHLELRRGFAYNHVMPDLNGRRYANYLRTAALCEIAGKPAPYLRERAELLKPLLKKRLWDPQSRWFRFEDDKGKGELRYTVQMFKMIGSGVLDKECEEGVLSHLNENEFLSAYGLHSLSKRDPGYDQLDIDNGGGGICTGFPPQIIERLYQAGRAELAADMLGRLLWWGETMPYWGDSITANCKDYRRDTPLQNMVDALAGAQCVIFGVFGVNVRPDGDITIDPHTLPFASQLTIRGLKLRGRSADVRIDGNQYEVRAGDQSIRSTIGKAVVISAKDGKVRSAE